MKIWHLTPFLVFLALPALSQQVCDPVSDEIAFCGDWSVWTRQANDNWYNSANYIHKDGYVLEFVIEGYCQEPNLLDLDSWRDHAILYASISRKEPTDGLYISENVTEIQSGSGMTMIFRSLVNGANAVVAESRFIAPNPVFCTTLYGISDDYTNTMRDLQSDVMDAIRITK